MRNRAGRNLLSEVNVTSLVDVSLTLLIIFMLVAPMMKHGIDVRLPHATAGGVDLSSQVVITIDSKEQIYLRERRISPEALSRYLVENYPEKVYLRADKDVPYGFVIKVMSVMRKAGVYNIGMVTEPE